MKVIKTTACVLAAVLVAGCDGTGLGLDNRGDKTVDRGLDSKDLSQLQAGIWIDPNGCDHWIIDDGFEGYLSQRLDEYGKPVCSGSAPPGYAIGNFKSGSPIEDAI
ncbi:MAG: hypothetical protein AAF982_01000 [Pseudomonadota bacterium]